MNVFHFNKDIIFPALIICISMCLFTLKIYYFLVPPTGVCVGLQYRPCKLSSHAGSWLIQTNLSNSGNTFTKIRLHYSASCFSLFQLLLFLSFYRALCPHSRDILKMTCNRIHPLLISPDLISHLLKMWYRTIKVTHICHEDVSSSMSRQHHAKVISAPTGVISSSARTVSVSAQETHVAARIS